jgi:hypothetical protein
MAYITILHVGKGDVTMDIDRFDDDLSLDFDVDHGGVCTSMTAGKADLITLRDYLNSMELD